MADNGKISHKRRVIYCGTLLASLILKGFINVDKKSAVKIIIECAKMYKDNFLGKNLMIIYGKDQYGFMEAVFPKTAYLHLTGVDTKLSPSAFYSKCIGNVLSNKDFNFKSNGTTELKLQILPHVFNPKKNYKIVGEYGNFKQILRTNKLVGGVHACLGFVKDGDYYVPNTTLNDDIREITSWNSRIVLILEKGLNDAQYNEITYVAKNVDAVGIIKTVKSDKIKIDT